MSPVAEAKIEALTAEVLVMKAGSRQITSGIYRQLDRVPADQIEPWGRVRDAHDDHTRAVHVVGRGSAGDLVRSSTPLYRERKLWSQALEFVRAENVLLASLLAEADTPILNNGKLILTFAPGAEFLKKKAEDPKSKALVRRALGELGYSGEPTYLLREGVVAEARDHYLGEYNRAEEWTNLPLIVLASMR